MTPKDRTIQRYGTKVPKCHVTNRVGAKLVFKVIAAVEIELDGVKELRLQEDGGRKRFGQLLAALEEGRFKDNAGSFKVIPWNVVNERLTKHIPKV